MLMHMKVEVLGEIKKMEQRLHGLLTLINILFFWI